MKYYFLVSGGKDSTAMVLKEYDEGRTGELLYGNTRLNKGYAKKQVQRLAEYVGWTLHEARYEGDQRPIDVLKESFHKLPEAFKWIEEKGTYGRKMFKCCDILKHGPMITWQKAQDKDSCFVLGLKGSDGALHRRYRMRELRERDTFYRRIKSNGLLYYYPLRDWTPTQVKDKLREHGFQDVKGTGCTICPIFCIYEGFRKADPDTWRRSVQMADRLGIEHPAMGQTFIPEFCK